MRTFSRWQRAGPLAPPVTLFFERDWSRRRVKVSRIPALELERNPPYSSAPFGQDMSVDWIVRDQISFRIRLRSRPRKGKQGGALKRSKQNLIGHVARHVQEFTCASQLRTLSMNRCYSNQPAARATRPRRRAS